MKILKIKLEGFGLFHEPKEFIFSDNKINLILGDNETGKSTVLKAVTGILFGMDKNRWQAVRSALPADKYYGECDFRLQQMDYKIYRNFETNEVIFSRKNQQGIIENLFKGKASPQSRTEEKEFYLDCLKKTIGLNNETIFLNTNVMFQRSLELKIDSEIQHILTGSLENNYRNSLNKWYEEYFQLTRTSPWPEMRDRRNDKEIELLTEELFQLNQKKDAIIAANIKAMEYDEVLEKEEQELKAMQSENEKLNKEFLLAKSYIDYLKEKDLLEEKLLFFSQNWDKFIKMKTELETHEALINENYQSFTGLDDEVLLALKEKQNLYLNFNKEKERLKKLKQESSGLSAKKISLAVNGLVIAGLFYFFRIRFQKDYFLYAALAAAALALGYFLKVLFSGFKSKVKSDTEVSSKQASINDLQTQIQELEKKTNNINPADLNDAFFIQYEEYKKLKMKAENLKFSMGNFTGLEDTAQKKLEIEKQLISVNTALKDLEEKNYALTTIKENREQSIARIQDIRDTITENEYKIEDKKNRILEITKKIASSLLESESLASIHYKVDEISDRLSRLQESARAYILAVNTLNEAIKEYQEKHIDRLAKNISTYFSRITNSRHPEVKLSEDFIPLILENDVNLADNLSCGTEDQLYFAVRLALVKELNDVTHLPLLLDDPFVNFDSQRLQIVKDIIYAMQEENQVILFSHFKYFTDWENVHCIKL